MKKRRAKRYTIFEYLKERYHKDIFIDININGSIRANMVDVSMNGVGFEIESIESSHLERLERADKFFITIDTSSEVIFAEVSKVWSFLVESEGGRILKGGLIFNVLSSEDRIKLSEFIERIRKRI